MVPGKGHEAPWKSKNRETVANTLGICIPLPWIFCPKVERKKNCSMMCSSSKNGRLYSDGEFHFDIFKLEWRINEAKRYK